MFIRHRTETTGSGTSSHFHSLNGPFGGRGVISGSRNTPGVEFGHGGAAIGHSLKCSIHAACIGYLAWFSVQRHSMCCTLLIRVRVTVYFKGTCMEFTGTAGDGETCRLAGRVPMTHGTGRDGLNEKLCCVGFIIRKLPCVTEADESILSPLT